MQAWRLAQSRVWQRLAFSQRVWLLAWQQRASLPVLQQQVLQRLAWRQLAWRRI
jgi:hypothetical protein